MKKNKSLGLLTGLCILSAVVILVMAGFLYRMHRQETGQEERISAMSGEIRDLQDTVDRLQAQVQDSSEEPGSMSSPDEADASAQPAQSSGKEIYKRVKTEGEVKDEEVYQYEQYLVLDGDSIYFSGDLSDKILEGTYTVDADNHIEYTLVKETQDGIFYISADYRFETINNRKTIVVDGGEYGKMYFEKTD